MHNGFVKILSRSSLSPEQRRTVFLLCRVKCPVYEFPIFMKTGLEDSYENTSATKYGLRMLDEEDEADQQEVLYVVRAADSASG
jgi:hypothetical protein